METLWKDYLGRIGNQERRYCRIYALIHVVQADSASSNKWRRGWKCIDVSGPEIPQTQHPQRESGAGVSAVPYFD
jgi:hypothetical protein